MFDAEVVEAPGCEPGIRRVRVPPNTPYRAAISSTGGGRLGGVSSAEVDVRCAATSPHSSVDRATGSYPVCAGPNPAGASMEREPTRSRVRLLSGTGLTACVSSTPRSAISTCPRQLACRTGIAQEGPASEGP